MCGITGFWYQNADLKVSNLKQIIKTMTSTLTPRGPDDHGYFVAPKSGLALGHRRLSIIDLHHNSAQPMLSHSGRYHLVFNGEIYNFQELKSELTNGGTNFKTSSDTEVLLACIDAWGIEIAVKRFNGMFAFAVWDQQEQMLYLARDRMGIKPLYWGIVDGGVVFGSELKALRACPLWKPAINEHAAQSYFSLLYIPSPYSIYKDIFKLQPGNIVTINSKLQTKITRYWSIQGAVKNGQRNKITGRIEEQTEVLENLLKCSVKYRMISDVPIGAFLSGGIDSSTVVAIMQSLSSKPVKTFSVGYEDKAYDEAVHAKAIANHLGTDHTELYLQPKEAIGVIPKLSSFYDEPFADASQIPTYLVSKLARENVTVALSGDGGDELFCGYTRYHCINDQWAKQAFIPRAISKVAGSTLRALPLEQFKTILKPVLQDATQSIPFYTNIMRYRSAGEYYLNFLISPAEEFLYDGFVAFILVDADELSSIKNPLDQLYFIDQHTYLPEDILAKVDRASMACSLEVRVPLLDHNIVEYSWQLPEKHKFSDGISKRILRNVLHKYVPQELMDRPKTGFHIPIADWLRGPLQDWAESLLCIEQLQKQNIVDSKKIRLAWNEHHRGEANHENILWATLMYQSWAQQWKM